MSVTVPATYRNKKTGKIYHTILAAHNASNYADLELMVLYYSREQNMSFVREITEFEEKFEYVSD